MVKLIVHIGHGKTGSSSIQETLLAGRQALADQGVCYLGLMLEHGARATRPDWQHRGGSDAYFAPNRDPDAANSELFDILDDILTRLDDQNVPRAIWSNEWLVPRSAMVLPALQRVAARGHEVVIQCYIRRHDRWIASAYAQWALKHKANPGPVRSFAEWLPRFHQGIMSFARDLQPWDQAFGDALKVYNFDAAGDVVSHFLDRNDLVGLQPLSDNVAPSRATMAAQAVFNSRKAGPVRPAAYDTVRSVLRFEEAVPPILPPLDQMLPDADALASIVRDHADDIARINTLLARSGEPDLDFSRVAPLPGHPPAWEMDQYLLRLIFGLTDEVQALRRQVAALTPPPPG